MVNLLERDENGITTLEHLLETIEGCGAAGVNPDVEKRYVKEAFEKLENQLPVYRFLTVLFGGWIAGSLFFWFMRIYG